MIKNLCLSSLVAIATFVSCSGPKNTEKQDIKTEAFLFQGKTMGTTYHIKQVDSVYLTQDKIDSLYWISTAV